MKWIDKAISIIEKPLKVLALVTVLVKTLGFLAKELKGLKKDDEPIDITDVEEVK